ncbi:hypothetical protein [Bacillus sp. FSL M8-0168]|uniref:hypothetical protein n=1 Tax=Bacillus sp. FSL M8-0168 TaxID=2921614 RepID=UPI0030FD2B79
MNEESIIKKYSHEIQDIANKLTQLENNRIYEITGAKMDGSLSTNIQQLTKMIAQLLRKIDNKAPSIDDELASLFLSNPKDEE